MLSIGLDVHHSTSTLHILEPGGKGRTLSLRGRPQRVVDWLGGLDQPWELAFEASCGYGHLYDQLVQLPHARRVVVAHPGKLAAIFKSKRKHDKADAQTLATLLRIDKLPTVWVPPVDLRRWRGLIEHRHHLVRCRSRAKHGLRSLLRTHAIEAPRSLWTRPGMAWLSGASMPDAIEALRRDQLLTDVERYQQMIERVEKVLNTLAAAHPAVTLLQTIPGIGPRTAEAFVAYVGDPHRFSRTRDVGAYFGLIPCQDDSAGQKRLGHITKEGPATVRWLLVEATWHVIRRSSSMRERLERVSHGKRQRRKIAVVAVARHLTRVMLAMLKTGTCWQEEPQAQQPARAA